MVDPLGDRGEGSGGLGVGRVGEDGRPMFAAFP